MHAADASRFVRRLRLAALRSAGALPGAPFKPDANVFAHQPLQMPLVEDNRRCQQVAAATLNEALGNAVLPRTSKASPLRLHAEAPDGLHNFRAEVRSTVEDQGTAELCRKGTPRAVAGSPSRFLKAPFRTHRLAACAHARYSIVSIQMDAEAGPAHKPLTWVADSREVVRSFPDAVKSDFGVALYQAQLGGKHALAKPLRGIGPGVLEIVSDRRGDTFRAFYTVRLADRVYVLHPFQKSRNPVLRRRNPKSN